MGFFNRLRRWVGAEAPAPIALNTVPDAAPDAAERDFARLNQVAPRRDAELPAGEKASFVRREPLLNRHERIAGYRFSLQERMQERLYGRQEVMQKIYDEALLTSLTRIEVNSLLGSRQAFVQLSTVSLENPLIARLPPVNSVLMINPAPRELDLARVGVRLAALRERGFRHGWLLRPAELAKHPALVALAGEADYAQIEAGAHDGLDIKELVRHLRGARPGDAPKTALIASQLGSFEEFNLCFQLGFDLFMGAFVDSREDWHPPKSEINRMLVLQLLAEVRGGAEFADIAEQIRREPVLSFKMLRYINSPLMGLQNPITSMDKALMVLGREKFCRWLSLLLFDIHAPSYRDRVLTEQALARARLLELLAGVGKVPKTGDLLFLLGLFSLLDQLTGQPMGELLHQARLPDAVRDALLEQPGPLSDALRLAKATESDDLETLETRAEACGLDAREVTDRAVEALAFACEVCALNDSA